MKAEFKTKAECDQSLPKWLRDGLETCRTELEANVLLKAHDELQSLQRFERRTHSSPGL